MKLSIVSTLYQSENYITEFYQRVSAIARQHAQEKYEIILVNDGSPDNSLSIVKKIIENDDHVVLIDLSRNFGHHKAMQAGLKHSKGEYVFLIDSDLEEKPEWLIDFSKQMENERADVIYGIQKSRKGNWFEKLSGSVYYRFINFLLNIDHPRNITTARLMTRRYVDAFLSYNEYEMVISCLWVITGFKQCPYIVVKNNKGSTSYGFLKKISYLVNAITSFSAAPLKMIFLLGMLIFSISMLYAIKLMMSKLFLATIVDGWTSIMISIWILGGLIISFIGVLGIYISKIFLETKQRPFVIVRNIYGRTNNF